jgi:hypothetical protein
LADRARPSRLSCAVKTQFAIRRGTATFNQLFPRRLDNTYRGRKIGLWVFALVVAFRAAQVEGILVNGASILRDGHGIALDAFTPADVKTLAAIYALSGLGRIVLLLLSVLVLLRYRSAIPLMFALLVLDLALGQVVLLHSVPIVRVPTASIVDLVLLAVAIIGLALSLWRRDTRAA